MNAQHQQEEEIQRLKVEGQIFKAEREAGEKEFEAESAKKRTQFKLEGKRKELEGPEELKRHNAVQDCRFIQNLFTQHSHWTL